MDMPKTFRFIMTDQSSNRSYCVCIIFTEEVSEEVYLKLTPSYMPSTKIKKYYDKAICIVSNYPFYENFKKYLSEIYRMQVSPSVTTSLEKHISYFAESILIDINDPSNAIVYEICSQTLKFHSQPIYLKESDFFNKFIYLPIVSCISQNTLFEIFKAILTEGKILFVSKSNNLLTNIITLLPSLLFPLKWPYVLIPLLPYKMQQFIDAPVPYIMGLNYYIDPKTIGDDILLINLDSISNGILKQPKDLIPDPPKALTERMLKKLKKIYSPSFTEENSFYVNDYDSVFASAEILENTEVEKFNSYELRDAFFEFFISLFKNYDKYYKFNKNNDMKSFNKSITIGSGFNVDLLRKDFNSVESDSFIYKFTETNLFTLFVDENFSSMKETETLQFLIDKVKNVKNGKDKDKFLFPIFDPTPNKIVDPVEKFCDSPKSYINNNSINSFKNINSSKEYKAISYSLFPKLDPSKFIQSSRSQKAFYSPKFIIQKDEWCFALNELSPKDSVKYVYLMVYEIWIELALTYLLNVTNPSIINETMNFIIFMLNELMKNKKIQPTRNLLYRIIKYLGSICIKEIDTNTFVSEILKLVPKSSQSKVYYALLDGYSKIKNRKESFEKDSDNNVTNYKINNDKGTFKSKGSVLISTNISNLSTTTGGVTGVRSNLKKYSTKKISMIRLKSSESLNDEEVLGSRLLLNGSGFICYNYCFKCIQNINSLNNTISYEEIICAFKKIPNLSVSICQVCNSQITPKLYIIHLYQQKANAVESVNLLFINNLIKTLELQFRIKDEHNFIFDLSDKYKEMKGLFWNLVFYFRYFALPTYILDKDSYLNSIELEIKESKGIILEKIKHNPSKAFSSTGKLNNEFSFFKSKSQTNNLFATLQHTKSYSETLSSLESKRKIITTSFTDWEKLLHYNM